MSYNTIAQSANDYDLLRRVAASAAQEGVEGDAIQWANEHIWQVVTASDIEAAYASALIALNPAPGKDESVVTDGMILAAVQPLTVEGP
jgi:hypothetical protein